MHDVRENEDQLKKFRLKASKSTKEYAWWYIYQYTNRDPTTPKFRSSMLLTRCQPLL